jgi:hypothetical protein
VAVVVVGGIYLSRFGGGRRIYAVGGNELASRFSGIRVGRVKSWFDDEVAYNLMYQEMIGSQPKIRVSMFDTQNQLRYQGCFNLAELDHRAYTRWNWVYISGLEAAVNPDREQLVTVTLPTAQLNMQNLDRAEIDVVRLVDCTKSSR